MRSPDKDRQNILHAVLAFRLLRRRHPLWQYLRRPAWDILLTIALGEAENHPITVSKVRGLALTSYSTALRIIVELETEGLVQRVQRSNDRRIVWLQLTDQGHRYVSSCLNEELEFYRTLSPTRPP